MVEPHNPERCTACGLEVAGGATGCQSMMDELVALHFGDVSYFTVHRLFVDTYGLQHPDRYCVSFKSLAAHLMHLCWSMEFGGTGAVPSEAIRRWLERHPHLEKPLLPATRGRITIGDVAGTSSGPAEHRLAVEEWARDVWEAYGDLQPMARSWLGAAFERKAARR